MKGHEMELSTMDNSSPIEQKARVAVRCHECRRRLGLTTVFQCKCGKQFCCTHRFPEEHVCQFDWKGMSRAALLAENPQVVACKVTRI